MKKIAVLSIVILFLSFKSNGQLKKGNWLIGGNARLSFQKETIFSSEARGFNFNISPDVGYFFIDKLAGGSKFSLFYNKVAFSGGVSKSTKFGIGPFLRYYFLNIDKRVNLFAESTYEYSHSFNSSGPMGNENVFTFSAGPVIYFNSSVGIEFTLNYELFRREGGTSAKTFYLGIGFQIHLEKDYDQQ